MDLRCSKCPAEFTSDELRRTKMVCPGCGLRFGHPRVEWVAQANGYGHFVALDDVKQGEAVQFITDVPVEIRPPQ